jgi:polysaccharide biosynthesis PFTS motif protein
MIFNNFFPNWKATNNQAEKGYEILKKEGRLNLLSEIRSDLLIADFNFNNVKNIFLEKEFISSNLLCKQYLFSRLITIEFNKTILASVYNKKFFFYPIPPLWQGILIEKKVHISKFWCTIAWLIFVSRQFVAGLLHIVRIVVYSFKSLWKSEILFNKSHSYFFDLSESSLYIDENNLNSRNVFSWFKRLKGDQNLILMHQVYSKQFDFSFNSFTVSYSNYFLAPITSLNGLRKYIFWGIRSIFLAVSNFVIGDWFLALFLKESSLLAQASFIDKNLLAKDFLFNNSSSLYRPLWSYVAEERGAEVLFYFYSIPSFDNVIHVEKRVELTESYVLLSWNKYFVWNDKHGDYVKKFVGNNPEIVSTGPILLSDSSANFDIPLNKFICVFDIQPFRDDFFRLLGLPEEYYTPDIAIWFLSDIKVVLSEFGLNMLHKRKRDVPKWIHPIYAKYLAEQKEEGVILVPPETSPIKVIERSIGVISMPFTSTAFLGIWNNLPSIYYDPTGFVCKNNPSANEVLVISGIVELREWVRNVLS